MEARLILHQQCLDIARTADLTVCAILTAHLSAAFPMCSRMFASTSRKSLLVSFRNIRRAYLRLAHEHKILRFRVKLKGSWLTRLNVHKGSCLMCCKCSYRVAYSSYSSASCKHAARACSRLGHSAHCNQHRASMCLHMAPKCVTTTNIH